MPGIPPAPRLAHSRGFALLAAAWLSGALPATADTLQLLYTNPTGHQSRVARTAQIRITFDRPLAITTVTPQSVRAYGRSSGPLAGGGISFADGNRTIVLSHAKPFMAGEPVFVNLSRAITAADGSPLRAAGYAFQFSVASGASPRVFTQIDTLLVRSSPSTPTRAYGGLASDFDVDGWTDLAIVNEISADLRVFMNRADGSGLFDPFLQPTTAIDPDASPNETADFNNDGLPDAATANGGPSTVSIVLGQGDGTFLPRQTVSVGAFPRGIAVLDVDGDGDLDIVTANMSGNNLSRLLNNGSGVFGPASHFEGGGSGEYGLAAGDFNGDGIFDLAVGTYNDQTVHVLQGNGDGTFTHRSSRASGGRPWMLAVGDVDGDLDLDVASANGPSGNGAVLKGNGDGTLGAAAVSSLSGSAVGTELGDLDGDGDLDWALASFSGSRWHVFVNDGSGGMTAGPVFDAPAAASCTVFMDFDNDTHLDMALVDEVADVVFMVRNEGVSIFSDGFEGGDTSAWSGPALR
jgi:hypothetical protein